jgi:DNA-binding transcriptional regulator YiaG
MKPCFTIEPLLVGELPAKELFSRVFKTILEEPFRNQLAMLEARGYRPKDLWTPHGRHVIKTIIPPVLSSRFSVRHMEAMDFAERIENFGHVVPDLIDTLVEELEDHVFQFLQKHQDEIFKKQAAHPNALEVTRKYYRDLVRSRLSTDKIIDLKSENLLTHSDFLTYSEKPNEKASHSMQKTKISHRIKSAREKLGLSQGQAAEKWNIRLQTLQQWEHGRRAPRGLYLERIEEILASIEQKA